MKRAVLLAVLSLAICFASSIRSLAAAERASVTGRDSQTGNSAVSALKAKKSPLESPEFQLESVDGILNPDGTLSADFSGTPPIGRSTLTLNISASTLADSFTNCNPITGSGTITSGNHEFTVELFNGELCGGAAHPIRYTMTGTIGIYAGTGECPGGAGQPQTAAVGTLVAYGAVHAPGNSTNPIPGSAASLISITGLTGAIPLCMP